LPFLLKLGDQTEPVQKEGIFSGLRFAAVLVLCPSLQFMALQRPVLREERERRTDAGVPGKHKLPWLGGEFGRGSPGSACGWERREGISAEMRDEESRGS